MIRDQRKRIGLELVLHLLRCVWNCHLPFVPHQLCTVRKSSLNLLPQDPWEDGSCRPGIVFLELYTFHLVEEKNVSVHSHCVSEARSHQSHATVFTQEVNSFLRPLTGTTHPQGSLWSFYWVNDLGELLVLGVSLSQKYPVFHYIVFIKAL